MTKNKIMTPTKDQQAQEYAEKKYTELMATLENGTCPMFRSLVKGCYLDGYTACEQSMWRSVEDELPEVGTEVIVAIDHKFYVNRYGIGRYQGKGWWYCQNIGTFADSVTHWRELPSLPDTNTEKKCGLTTSNK